MKIISKLGITLAIFLLGSLSLSAQDSDNQSKKEVVEVKILTSAICDMCKNTIEKELAYTNGVVESNLDVATKTVTIKYKNWKTSEEELIKAINNVGYDAGNSPADAKAYENLHFCCKKESH